MLHIIMMITFHILNLYFDQNRQHQFMNKYIVVHMKNELRLTRQVTRAMHVRNRVCPRVKLILTIMIILLIIFIGFIKSKPC